MLSGRCQALRFALLPSIDAEWEAEVRGFLEFSCVGAWDGFHVYIS